MAKRIPAENLERLQSAIEKLNKRARKLGMDEIALFVSQLMEEKILNERTKKEGVYQYYEVAVQGAAPKINGWTFIATIQHVALEDGKMETILRMAPNQKLETARYAGAVPSCDHCSTLRRRKDTFVLRNDAGDEKRVGRQCLADFINTDDPSKVVAWFEFLMAADAAINECSEWDSGDSSGSGLPTVKYFLQIVAAIIRKDGWLGRTKARELYEAGGIPKRATADKAGNILYLLRKGGLTADEQKVVDEYRTTDEEAKQDEEMVDSAIEWAKTELTNKADADEYEHNLSVAARMMGLAPKTDGIVASLIPAYKRAIGDVRKKSEWAEKAAKSVHFGEIGKRAVFELAVTGTTVIEGNYGPKTVVRFADKNGNMAVWFASGNLEQDFVTGETYQLKVTVKEHSEYKGAKQTILSRCAVDGQWRCPRCYFKHSGSETTCVCGGSKGSFQCSACFIWLENGSKGCTKCNWTKKHVYCGMCTKWNAPGTETCPSCHWNQAEKRVMDDGIMRCPECGTWNAHGTAACTKCGRKPADPECTVCWRYNYNPGKPCDKCSAVKVPQQAVGG